MEKEFKQHEVLQWASLFLKKHNREEKVAELLLQHFLHVSRSEFFTMMRDPVPEKVAMRFQDAIEMHAETGVPIQHIIGHEEFYGRKFSVNEHTLIPRPETEELVQQVIETTPDEPLTIADIGTGSGIIALTLALELPQATVYATDISQDALTVARQNAKQLGADVTFLQGDFLTPLIGKKTDIIVSNPPYIAHQDKAGLVDTVKKFDPELALFADENGLASYRQIIEDLPHVINDHAAIFFEIGDRQGEAIRALLSEQFPTSNVQIIKDINKKDRIIQANIKK
ncbi:peptide chain release factor N(5)-glutamine methyltransferase [Virgibacillus litoralis]|uniref:Release factor glutamine methyltransferase n=1 Tax=Virgibacillus litoralis TaxID=578221 RepID=A0ABS4HD89_9BACI|nr:peptide chain release factor N(5)-glutamine methyltransferase [Virgibacillus litoralis]MBP1948871.1 release factor glutamine methyltransferase [Virgibacillus litoralis]